MEPQASLMEALACQDWGLCLTLSTQHQPQHGILKSHGRNYTTIEQEGDKPFRQMGFLEGKVRQLRTYLKATSPLVLSL